jgi:hypothetical protein
MNHELLIALSSPLYPRHGLNVSNINGDVKAAGIAAVEPERAEKNQL